MKRGPTEIYTQEIWDDKGEERVENFFDAPLSSVERDRLQQVVYRAKTQAHWYIKQAQKKAKKKAKKRR